MPGTANDLNISEPGYVTFDGTSVFHGRTFQAGAGITLSNASGVGGNTTISLSGGGVAVQHLTGDSGGQLNPDGSNNFNLLGQQAGSVAVMDTIGSGSTIKFEDRTWISSLVVDPSSTVGLRGTFTTVQAAITAASAGQTIYIRPGAYHENLTMKAGITLVAMIGDNLDNNVQIFGSITCTYAGISSITGCKLVATTAGGIIMSGAAGTQLYLKSCTVYQFSGAGTHYSFASSNAANSCSFYECYFDTDANGAWFNLSDGAVYVSNSSFANTGGSTSPNLLSGGQVTINNTDYGIANENTPPWTISGGIFTAFGSTLNGEMTTSATSTFEVNNCRIFTDNVPFTLGGSAHNIFNSEISCGNNAAISVSTVANIANLTISSTATNAITGVGTINYANLAFTGSSSTISTTTQTRFALGPVVNTAQPKFFAYLSANAANVTGDGTNFQVPYDTVVYDNFSGFTVGASSHYTFPVAGRWEIKVNNVYISDATAGFAFLTTVQATSEGFIMRDQASAVNILITVSHNGSFIFNAAKGDTLAVFIQSGGGTKTTGIIGTASPYYTSIQGVLLPA